METGEKAAEERGGGNGTPRRHSDEADEPAGGGGGDSGGTAHRMKAPCLGVAAEPEEGPATDAAGGKTAIEQRCSETPTAEGEGQGVAAGASRACSGGDVGGSSSGSSSSSCRGKGISGPNAAPPGPTDAASPSTEPSAPPSSSPPSSSSTDKDLDGRPSHGAAGGAGERLDCDGRGCGGDVPPAQGETKAKVQPEAEAGASGDRPQQQQQQVGLRDSIDVDNDPNDAQTLGSPGGSSRSSSGSSAEGGCTTGETRGSSADHPREDSESAFGSECSEGNSNGNDEEKPEDGAGAVPTAVAACTGLDSSSDELGIGMKTGAGGDSVAGSPSACSGEGEGAAVGEGVSAGEGQGSPSSPDDGVGVVTGENDRGARRDSSADEGRGNPAAPAPAEPAPAEPAPAAPAAGPAAAAAKAEGGEEGESASAPVAASQHPLNRLQEPPARLKPEDRKHDPDVIDLYRCLDHFMAEEKLVAEDGNGYDCESCNSRPPSRQDDDGEGGGGGGGAKARREQATRKRQQNAQKRLLMLGQPPGVLVCHLKRLQPKKKIIRSVEFPIELDMAPYFWRDPEVGASSINLLGSGLGPAVLTLVVGRTKDEVRSLVQVEICNLSPLVETRVAAVPAASSPLQPASTALTCRFPL